MKQIINGIFREKATTILIIGGFAISFFVTINAIKLIDEYISIRTAHNTVKYNNEFKLEVNYNNLDDNEEIFETKLKECVKIISTYNEGNIEMFLNNSVFINGAQKPLNYIVCYNEKPQRKLASGRYPTKEELDKGAKVVVIGSSVEASSTKKNNKQYIDIGGETYEVIGVLEDAYKNTDLNYVVYTGIDKFGYLEEIDPKETIYIYVGTNLTDVDAIYEKLELLLNENGFDVLRIDGEDVYDIDRDIAYDNAFLKISNIFQVVLLIAAIINCIVVSDIWISTRLQEFAIKKAFGKSTMGIVGDIFCQMIFPALMAVLLSVFLEILYGIIYGIGVEAFSLNDILMFILAIFVIISITICVPVFRISRIKPARALKSL